MKAAELGAGGKPGVLPADLPVLEIARQAFYLPVRYPLALIRLGGIPALLAVAARMVAAAIVTTGLLSQVAPAWLFLIDTFVYIPFAVGWTRLAFDGPVRVAARGPFHFRRTEARYLLAVALFSMAWLLVLFPLYLLERFAHRTLDHQLALEASVLITASVFVLAIVLARSLFILPAVALNQYHGIAEAWRQSKCSLERLLALETIAHLPYLIALAILARLDEPYYPWAERAGIAAAQCVAWMFSQAFVAGALALAYQHARMTRVSNTPEKLSPA